ncbi:MAG: YegP family protein [Lautropia sp.]|nr:YegP family protein [Lautropia sp.]
MAAWFELGKSSDGQFRFSLKHESGTLLNSELYKAKPSAQSGIASVQSNSANEGRYEKKASSNGKHYFNLKASNGQVIGTSPMYGTEADRDDAIAAVKAGGATTDIRDSA